MNLSLHIIIKSTMNNIIEKTINFRPDLLENPMDRTNADYIQAAKAALGNPHMSDRQLGELLGGFTQPAIGNAKAGKMHDPLALAIAAVLPDVEAGEILWVARMEREKDEKVKAALSAYLGKTLAAMTLVAASSTASASGVLAADLVHSTANSQRVCIM